MPSRRERAALAGAALTAFLLDGLLLLSLVGMASPARFGSVGSRAFGSGWRTLVLAGVAVLCALWLASRWRGHRWVLAKAREPFQRPLEDDPAFAGAAGALGAARAPLKTRYALGWIWAPGAAVLGAVATSLTVSYFLVDAVLARFEIGWQQPVLAAVNLVLSWALLRAAAGRIAVWPLAVSVHREATTGYS